MSRRLALAIALVAAVVFVGSAFAGTYAGVRTWLTGEDGASGYSTSHNTNDFYTNGAYATTVTFIDATGYNWHNTSAITSADNHTDWNGGNETRKAYCLYRDQFSTTGSCAVG